MNIITTLKSFFVCACGETGFFRKRRLNTAYQRDELNYVRCCDKCFELMWQGYEAMWEEYYGSR
jgi:hypothetical protein